MPENSDSYMETLKGGETYTSLEVVKNTKGYNWTVKVAGMDLDKIKSQLVETEEFVRKQFGSES